jgi:C-terminal processing protease CtpA/Prc
VGKPITLVPSCRKIQVLLTLTLIAVSAPSRGVGATLGAPGDAADHEFDAGSKIQLASLTQIQVDNLATLCRVWGFLKYHHPAVTAGRFNWDYELLRVLPTLLAADSCATADAILVRWIDGLGKVVPVKRPVLAELDVDLRPELAWIDDESLLGRELSEQLREIYAGRPLGSAQFYVTLHGIGIPEFTHESNYSRIELPDAGFQLLGLFRFWNIIRYWYPYRDLIDHDWDSVLTEFIPRVGLARSAHAYKLAMMALIAQVGDTHANLWSSLGVRPPEGDSLLPINVRFIEGRPVVTSLVADQASSGFQRGDVIVEIDGMPVEKLVAQWAPFYGDSNETARLRDIGAFMGRGPKGPAKVRVLRGTEIIDVDTARVQPPKSKSLIGPWHDLPGPTFRLLSKDVAYLKLSSVKAAEATWYVEQAAGTKGWIIDMRDYPSDFVVFALGSHLVAKDTEFARFTAGTLADPGAFAFSKALSLVPESPHYGGKVVILVDDATQSAAEYTAMAFRSDPMAVVVGSTTAGADGNVAQIPLPGGLRSMISSIGVFYPDKRPTQRIGIVPDIVVKPTIAGVRAGRDEVLEAGLRQILGPQVPDDEIRKLAAPNE